ncbi:MAG: hypothetical protein AAB614_00970 [Patescibacteria group bacterium]
MNFKKKQFILILSLLLIVFFGFFLTPNPAYAGLGDNVMTGFLRLINWVLRMIMDLESLILALIGSFADSVMQPEPITKSFIVENGWNIARDFANMFFILILLAIALSFILFPRFQIKQALPRLLAIALLINFSLPIAGLFIDFANIFSATFFKLASAGTAGISETVAGGLGITNIYTFNASGQFGGDTLDSEQKLFKILLLGIFFMGILIFIFLALGMMFLIRNMYLYILLILLPLALVASILPQGKSYFSSWTGKFFQWTFFAPVALFFIYLAIASFQSIIGSKAQDFAAKATMEDGIPLLAQTYNYIAILGLLIGSLVAANSLGIRAAGASLTMLKKGGKIMRNGIGRGVRGVGRYAKREAVYNAERLSASKGIENVSSFLSGIPLVGAYAGRTGLRAATRFKLSAESRGKISDKEKKLLDSMSDKQQLKYYEDMKRTNSSRATTLAGILAEKGTLTKFDPKKSVDENNVATKKLKDDAYADAVKVGNKNAQKAIERSAPQIFEDNLNKRKFVVQRQGEEAKDSETGLTKNEMTQAYYRGFRPSDVEKMDKGMLSSEEGKKFLKNLQIYGNMSGEHLKSALRTGSHDFLKAFEDSIKSMSAPEIRQISENNKNFVNFVGSTAARGLSGAKELSEKIKLSQGIMQTISTVRQDTAQALKNPRATAKTP